MSEDGPSKADLQIAMRKLRALSANKLCFDCQARNPTWATVTYGVFLCIDCSAVHRNLGVHLTFVRSTNLDTNWNWLQLRAMQVGGNSNAMQFFKQHGCNTTDAQQKYKSRAAQLYKDKLSKLCQDTQRKYGTKVLIDTEVMGSEKKEENEEDFFSQEFGTVPTSQSETSLCSDAYIAKEKKPEVDPTHGPRVDHIDSEAVHTSAPVSVILKKPVKKSGLGAKKGGLGAQKVRINFDELEQRAAEHEKVQTETAAALNMNYEEEEKDKKDDKEVSQISARLAMQNIDVQRKNMEAKVASDPTKAAAVDRLGMGGLGRPRAAHSVAGGIRSIQQQDLSSRTVSTKRDDEDWEFVEEKSTSSKSRDDDLFSTDLSSKSASNNDFFDSWEQQEQKQPQKSRYTSTVSKGPVQSAAPEVDVAKKFGNAKAISSDMYFGNNEMDYETKSALSRFEGVSSLGSEDLWGNGTQNPAASSGYSSQVPEMSDIKDSLRAGASKVAEKFSTISTSLSSYMSLPEDDYVTMESKQSLVLTRVNEWSSNRENIKAKLLEIALSLEKLKFGCNVANTAGSATGIVGGAAAITGLLLFPPAAMAGLAVSIAAAAGNITTGVVQFVRTKKLATEAREFLTDDEKRYNLMSQAREKMDELVREHVLSIRHPIDNSGLERDGLNDGGVHGVAGTVGMGATALAGVTGRMVIKSSAEVTSSLAKGMAHAAIAVGVAIDAITLIISSRDLVLGSKSELAMKLRTLAEELEEERIRIYARYMEHYGLGDIEEKENEDDMLHGDTELTLESSEEVVVETENQ